MKRLLFAGLLAVATAAQAGNAVYSEKVKTLQAVVNQDWLSPQVMKLGGDVLNVSFDELSHDYHRYVYRIEHCEYDWAPSDDIFDSDWLEGFNSNPIDDYETSLNTTILYTHYRFSIPNERCRLKMSGNYRLHIVDEDTDNEVALVEFRVTDQTMGVNIGVTTNTDIDVNRSHQQVTMVVRFNGARVTRPEEQIRTVVMLNAREDNMKEGVRPNFVTADGMRWEHNRGLIFDGGNEYHKFEVLDVTHPTMGLDRMVWDGGSYQAYPFTDTPRRNYVYDEDANGAFYIRNSDNTENDRTCEYVYVNYKLQPAPRYAGAHIMVDGRWATAKPDTYVMTYDSSDNSYNARILQKQGYYSYQYVMRDFDGTVHPLPEEGSFAETENQYQALVYYKGTGERTWRLTAYQQIKFK